MPQSTSEAVREGTKLWWYSSTRENRPAARKSGAGASSVPTPEAARREGMVEEQAENRIFAEMGELPNQEMDRRESERQKDGCAAC